MKLDVGGPSPNDRLVKGLTFELSQKHALPVVTPWQMTPRRLMVVGGP